MDGSTHLVPVVNIAALQLLQESYSEENDCMNTAFLDDSDVDQMDTNEFQCCLSQTLDQEPTKNIQDISLTDFYEISADQEYFIKYLQELSLRAKEQTCSKCNTNMLLVKKPNKRDGFVFRCAKCKNETSIRKNSLFSKRRMSLKDIFIIMYLWASAVPGHVAVKMMPNVSMKTIYEWYQVCRDVTERNLRENPIIFGSSVIITSVQIDESLFQKQQKYHTGKYTKQKWLFGMVEIHAKHTCFSCIHARKACML